jgi:hypothetical protein
VCDSYVFLWLCESINGFKNFFFLQVGQRIVQGRTAVVLGHSFVFGLLQHLEGKNRCHPQQIEAMVARELRVNMQLERVFWMGSRGERACDYVPPVYSLSRVMPAVILLELASNDLARGSDVKEVKDRMVTIAVKLANDFGAVVGIMSVIPRKSAIGRMNQEEFGLKAGLFNMTVRVAVKALDVKHIFFHKHRGFTDVEENGKKSQKNIDVWSRDGVHPNKPDGRRLYKTSLRKALMEAVYRLRDVGR